MDAFERVAPTLGDVEHPAAYLRAAVINAARSHHRRRALDARLPVPADPSPSDHRVDELWDRLGELRPDERTCVVLRFYEDLPLAAIAEQLDLPARHREVPSAPSAHEAPLPAHRGGPMSPHDEPSHDDLTELDLTAAQADDLAALLHGAAARVEVPAAAAPVPLPTRRPPTRWLAAAALVVVAAIGAGWWLTVDEGERVHSGPADPSPTTVTVAPHVLEQTGVWRLPEGLDGTSVVGAQRSNAMGELLFAFDDPDDPTRWIAFGRYGLRPSLPNEDVVLHPVVDGVQLVDWSADGAKWTGYEVRVENGMGTGDSPAMTVITQGLGRDEVVDLVHSTFPDRAALLEPDRLTAALAAIDLPDGLHPTWDEADLVATFGEQGPESSTFTELQVTLFDDAGREIVVTLSDATTSATALQADDGGGVGDHVDEPRRRRRLPESPSTGPGRRRAGVHLRSRRRPTRRTRHDPRLHPRRRDDLGRAGGARLGRRPRGPATRRRSAAHRSRTAPHHQQPAGDDRGGVRERSDDSARATATGASSRIRSAR